MRNAKLRFLVPAFFAVMPVLFCCLSFADEVNDLINELNNGNEDARVEAAMKLEKIGSPRAVADLFFAFVKDPSPAVRMRAKTALVKMGPQVKATIIKALSSKNGEVRYGAVKLLQEIGEKNDIPAIEKLLKNKDEDIKNCAMQVIDAINSEVKPDNTPTPAKAEPKAKPEQKEVPAKPDAKTEPKGEQKEVAKPEPKPESKPEGKAAEKTGSTGAPCAQIAISPDKPPVPEKKELSRDELSKLRAKSTAGLAGELKNPDDLVRQEAISELSRRGKDALTVLFQKVTDQDERVYQGVAAILQMMANDEITVLILKKVMDPSPRVSQLASDVAGKLGTKAIPALIELSKDADKKIQVFALKQLGETGDEKAVQVIAGFLKSDDEEIRNTVLPYLEKSPEKTGEALAALVQEKGISPSVRKTVMNLLRKSGTDNIAKVIGILLKGGSETQEPVSGLLTALGDAASDPLAKLMESSDDKLIMSAIASIDRIKLKGAIPALLGVLKSDKIKTRIKIAAIDTLGDIGSKQASDEIGALVADPGQPDDIRSAAAKALTKLKEDEW